MQRRRLFLAPALVALGLGSGCAPSTPPVPFDAPRPSGSFACGSATCDASQICFYDGSGTDAGTGPSAPVCVSRPPACEGATDCSWSGCDEQAACIEAVCGDPNPCPTISDFGRAVSCCRA